MRCSEIRVIKKDGTREEFNIQKVVVAVNKSAERAMIRFPKQRLILSASSWKKRPRIWE